MLAASHLHKSINGGSFLGLLVLHIGDGGMEMLVYELLPQHLFIIHTSRVTVEHVQNPPADLSLSLMY